MRNSIGRAVVKLAAAAVTVAGVVGTGWAQAPTTPSATLKATYTVEERQKIETISRNLTKTELELTKAGDAAAALTKAQDPGNLGIIKVTTNSAAWDVQMLTKYGGKLVFNEGGAPTGTSTCSGTIDPWNSENCIGGTWIPDVGPGTLHSLTYIHSSGVGAGDTVKLEVAIGVADSGAYLSSSAVKTSYYALGAPSGFAGFSPSAVTTSLAASAETNPATGAAGSKTPISFAENIGTTGSSWTLPTTPTWITGNVMGSLASKKTFTVPNINEQAYFYVNVGLNRTNTATLFGGNKGGDYEETFTFNLVANF